MQVATTAGSVVAHGSAVDVVDSDGDEGLDGLDLLDDVGDGVGRVGVMIDGITGDNDG